MTTETVEQILIRSEKAADTGDPEKADELLKLAKAQDAHEIVQSAFEDCPNCEHSRFEHSGPCGVIINPRDAQGNKKQRGHKCGCTAVFL